MTDNITDFYEGLQRLIKLFVTCWQTGEGKIEISVSDDKGAKEWKLSGGPVERSKKVNGGGE